jgi:glycosyltransferase involved in cell wall biosynthesis
LYRSLRYPGRHDSVEAFKGGVLEFTDVTAVRFAEGEIVIGVGTWSSVEIQRLDGCRMVLVQFVRGGRGQDRRALENAFSCPIPKLALAPHLVPLVEEVSGQKPVAVVPNGIDTSEYFSSVPEEERDGVGLVFHTLPVKAPEVALGVLEQLGQDVPRVPWYVFGAVRRPQGIPRRSYWMFPSVSKARELYSRARVWIVPSHGEGFSRPVLEAMACGAAVVSTDCGGPGDMIRDGENGFLVPVGDVEGLVERANRLLSDEALRLHLVRNAFTTVKAFAWERSADKLEEALRAIVSMRAA